MRSHCVGGANDGAACASSANCPQGWCWVDQGAVNYDGNKLLGGTAAISPSRGVAVWNVRTTGPGQTVLRGTNPRRPGSLGTELLHYVVPQGTLAGAATFGSIGNGPTLWNPEKTGRMLTWQDGTPFKTLRVVGTYPVGNDRRVAVEIGTGKCPDPAQVREP